MDCFHVGCERTLECMMTAIQFQISEVWGACVATRRTCHEDWQGVIPNVDTVWQMLGLPEMSCIMWTIPNKSSSIRSPSKSNHRSCWMYSSWLWLYDVCLYSNRNMCAYHRRDHSRRPPTRPVIVSGLGNQGWQATRANRPCCTCQRHGGLDRHQWFMLTFDRRISFK